MGEWISRAANVFKREVSETPQPFEVCCECGQKHIGVRRIRHQHLVCKGCGASLFVLPHNTYPPPHLTKPSPTKRKKQKPVSANPSTPIDLSAEPLPEPDHEDSPSGELPRRRLSRSRRQKRLASASEAEPNFVVRYWSAVCQFIADFWNVFWSFWTLYRTLALLICCLLGLTAYYSIYQVRLRDAVSIAKVEFEEGLSQIETRNWVAARDHFKRASQAVDLLERKDTEANSIRQFYRETTALTRLSSTSLPEFIELAEEYYVKHGAENWQQEFRKTYQDDWSIIEGYLRPTNAPEGVTKGEDLELVFPLSVGEKRRHVHIRVTFDLATHLPKVSADSSDDAAAGTLSVFAAQMQSCELDGQGEWLVRMNPKTSFLWVNRPTYQATHLEEGSIQPLGEQQQMLDLQAKWMGVKQ